MPTIIERGGRFLARARRSGQSAAKTFTKRADAAAWCRKTEADMEAGRWVDAAAMTATARAADAAAEAARVIAEANQAPTMAQAMKLYRTRVVAAMKGAATYAYWLDELEAAPMAGKSIDNVTSADLAAWRDEQRAKLAAGTVVRKLGLLGGFFTWCHKERGWIKANPLASVRKPRVNDARDRVLSDDERRYLMAAAGTSRADWLSDVLVVLLQSAMRRGELWGLQRADVDYAQAVAHLADTKNGSARDVPLCPLALAALRRLDEAAEARRSTALVPLSEPHAVSLAFRRTVARARSQYLGDCAATAVKADPGFLTDVRLHDCRHTAATNWALTGALSVFELQQVTGHKTVKMLSRYVSLKSSTLAAKLAQLSTPQQKAA